VATRQRIYSLIKSALGHGWTVMFRVGPDRLSHGPIHDWSMRRSVC
jgi:hypothetical protein